MKIDTIIENANFQTMNPNQPFASRIGVQNGRIVGLDTDLDGVSATEIVDLAGAYALPGFNDAHFHFSGLGQDLSQLDLRTTAVPTLDDLYELVRSASEHAEPGEWILGRGFNQLDLGAFPDIEILDKISAGHPVFLVQVSGHVSVVNHRAFELVGIMDPDNAPDPAGGQIVRQNGRATGVIKEKAREPFQQLSGSRTEETLLGQLHDASEYALQRGLTSFTEPGVGTDRRGVGMGQTPGDFGTFQNAYDRDLIGLRGTLMPYYGVFHELGEISEGVDGFGLDLNARTGFGDDWLRIGAFKVQIDGSFNGLSALLKCPYEGHAHETGVLQWDTDELQRRIVQLHRQGWQIAAHAIGDEGVDLMVSAIEMAQNAFPRADARHRIEHCGLADDAMVERIIAADIIPVPQGSFILQFGDNYREVLGEERAADSWRMGSFVRRGTVIPGSTDSPVATLDPLYSIQGMVTRKTQSGFVLGGDRERVSVDEALRAYTYGSAYASHQEHDKGTLSVGMLADIVALSDDPHEVHPDEISEISVQQTIVGGSVQYSA